jgi:predicted acylesterase/phospholipase RssA
MYESLVLSAGGTHGVAYVGAYKALEARYLTSSIRRFHGTSAGSIVAAMAAYGLTSAEMLRAMETMCASPRPRLKMADFSMLAKDFGTMDVGRYLKPVLDAFLPPAATFVTLAKSRGVSLSVHAYNVCDRSLVDFGLDATPDADIRECIQASCCVPFMFKPVIIGDRMHVDGAVAQRTPMHMVVDPCKTLVLDVRNDGRGAPQDILQYMSALTSAASRHVGGFAGDFVTVPIPRGAPGLLDLPAPMEAMDALVEAGFSAVDALIARKLASTRLDLGPCVGGGEEEVRWHRGDRAGQRGDDEHPELAPPHSRHDGGAEAARGVDGA